MARANATTTFIAATPKQSAKNTQRERELKREDDDDEKASTVIGRKSVNDRPTVVKKTSESSFFIALARVDISDYANRVDRLYRWYLDREEKEEAPAGEERRNDRRTNNTATRYHHPGVAIRKFLNEHYFEPLAKLASKHEGTVLNYAGDAACCLFRERRKCFDDGKDNYKDERNDDEAKVSVKKRAELFAEEVINGRWLFSPLPECPAKNIEEEAKAHFFFRDVRVRIAVASGRVKQIFVGGYCGRYERVLLGEACETLAREAQKAKPREISLTNECDEYDDPETQRYVRREMKHRINNNRTKAPSIPQDIQKDETVAIVFMHISLRELMSTAREQALCPFVLRVQKVCARHDGTFLQLSGDEGDSLAIVIAFRTRFAKDSLLAKTVASRNALRFSTAIAQSLKKKKKKNIQIKIEKKGNETTRQSTTPRRRRRRQHQIQNRNRKIKATLGVSLGNCSLGIVGDSRSPTSSDKEFLATGRAVNRAARFAKGETLCYNNNNNNAKNATTKKMLVRVDAESIVPWCCAIGGGGVGRGSSFTHQRAIKVRVKGGEVWNAFSVS